jgi:hypothetical protein
MAKPCVITWDSTIMSFSKFDRFPLQFSRDYVTYSNDVFINMLLVRKRKCFGASRRCTSCLRKFKNKIKTEGVDEKLEDGER